MVWIYHENVVAASNTVEFYRGELQNISSENEEKDSDRRPENIEKNIWI